MICLSNDDDVVFDLHLRWAQTMLFRIWMRFLHDKRMVFLGEFHRRILRDAHHLTSRGDELGDSITTTHLRSIRSEIAMDHCLLQDSVQISLPKKGYRRRFFLLNEDTGGWKHPVWESSFSCLPGETNMCVRYVLICR